ncbi:MAG: glycoside hydrolase family 3 C-terminal domain-containing protein [Eubacteriales bacterium]|nr:glycoside hydrolase family 3 C-terminal domain-containing protein [Eubacteriales bacterium]
MKFTFDWKEYGDAARQMAAEGCVLLRNEAQALPVRSGERVSVFGRIQNHYYKSGTGSGGMVNAPYVVSIMDGLRAHPEITLNEKLAQIYTQWEESHPFDKGEGWAREPWSQEEMEISGELAAEAAAVSDVALVILGRSAGEDRDACAQEGSYYLTQGERSMLSRVTAAFSRVAVVLNVGAVMDMSWVQNYRPQAVLYVWQGGMEGGNGVADILTGRVSPSGKLADTIARRIEDYPSTEHFGDEKRNFYVEDIYVGYRYFESAAPECVLYPFGYGLSYTSFAIETGDLVSEGGDVSVRARVTNTGDVSGKEVVQIYGAAPQGALAKPLRSLLCYGKTRELAPGESQTLTLSFPIEAMASYDDTGATGHKSCWILEQGEYGIYAGNCVRDAFAGDGQSGAKTILRLAGRYVQPETAVVQTLEEACAPTTPFERMRIAFDRPQESGQAAGQETAQPQNGAAQDEPIPARPETARIIWERAPLRTIDLTERIAERRPEDSVYTGDRGLKLRDVREGRATMEEFLAQLSDEDLIHMTRGEGMCSPKVTPGIAGAIGGVTGRLQAFGIPAMGCSDGPSGIRMDCGTKAFSCPNGTLMACSFNLPLTERLYDMVGRELRRNRIDALLGPGLNIHRNPLNGRNFEYFSEDPYLTGSMAAAQLRAMHRYHVTGTVKHFVCNDQETARRMADAVVSERALREIYLKPFEIAVREGGAYSVMSTYGPLNGFWTASSYDLLTTVLRGDWGFRGLVMTDWWAEMNEEGGQGTRENTVPMVRAQNDVYMVTDSAADNSGNDNSEEGLREGRITRGELLRNAANICRTVMRSAVMDFACGERDEIEECNRPAEASGAVYEQGELTLTGAADLDVSRLVTEASSNNVYAVRIPERGKYRMRMELRSTLSALSQATVTFSINSTLYASFTLSGTEGAWVSRTCEFARVVSIDNYLNFYFAQSGLEIRAIRLERIETEE